MAAPVLKVTEDSAGTSYWMWCPGCDDVHRVNDLWSWNGSLDAPTFTPSILVHSHKTLVRGHAVDTPVCHSYLTDGVWRFLADSTHAMAGQSVPMVPLPEWLIQ